MLEIISLISFGIIDRKQLVMSNFVITLIAIAFYLHFSTEEDETSEMLATIAFVIFIVMLFKLTFSL